MANNYTDVNDTDFKTAPYDIDSGLHLSAGGVRAALHTKENVGNKKDIINDNSTEYPSSKAVYAHTSRTDNPHSVTLAQIGGVSPEELNKSIEDVKNAVDTALLTKENISNKKDILNNNSVEYPSSKAVYAHTSRTDNPHSVTLVQLGGVSLAEIKLLIGNFNAVVHGYDCERAQTSYGSNGYETWYKIIRYCITRTRSEGRASVPSEYNNNLADEYCINYQNWAVRTPGAYRLLTNTEWLDAHQNNKISDKNSGAIEWTGDLADYWGYSSGDWHYARVAHSPNNPAANHSPNAQVACRFRLAWTVQ